ncbi:MAG: methionyl-tRNA formyltransferase [Burkholderiaceae bacterium]
MRLIFAGTPEFAAQAMRSLMDAGHAVVLVLSQPDRPAGRGMQLQASPVKRLAQQRGVAVCQPRSLRLDGRFADDALAAREAILAAGADGMVVAAYGLILPQWVLDGMESPGEAGGAGLGCLNIHASLLPRWRGAAPIHRAIEAGDTQTGVCIMQMDAGLDTGPIVACQTEPIRQEGPQADTTGSLQERLAELGGTLIVQVLAKASSGLLPSHPQATDGVRYADKVNKSQACVDWNASAAQVEHRIRAFDPFPGAWTTLGADTFKLWRAVVQDTTVEPAQPPGTVLAVDSSGIAVACGDGRSVRLLQLQRAGGKSLPVADFLRGQPVPVGVRLG